MRLSASRMRQRPVTILCYKLCTVQRAAYSFDPLSDILCSWYAFTQKKANAAMVAPKHDVQIIDAYHSRPRNKSVGRRILIHNARNWQLNQERQKCQHCIITIFHMNPPSLIVQISEGTGWSANCIPPQIPYGEWLPCRQDKTPRLRTEHSGPG